MDAPDLPSADHSSTSRSRPASPTPGCKSTITSTDEDGAVSVVSGIEAGKRLPTTPRFQTAATSRWLAGAGWVGYLSGTFQHVGSRFTQVGDQTEGFSAVNLIALSPVLHPGTFIGGPLAKNTFAFNPELPAYNILNARVGFLNGRWDSRLLRRQPDRRARVPGPRPGAGYPGPGSAIRQTRRGASASARASTFDVIAEPVAPRPARRFDGPEAQHGARRVR